MSDARDCESYLRQLQDTIKRQYTCDKNSRLGRLEDMLQDSMVGLPSFLKNLDLNVFYIFYLYLLNKFAEIVLTIGDCTHLRNMNI